MKQPISASVKNEDKGEEAVSGGSLQLTGHLGDVMKESAQIAHTVAKSFLASIDSTNQFLQKAHVHIHVPEVAYYEHLFSLF